MVSAVTSYQVPHASEPATEHWTVSCLHTYHMLLLTKEGMMGWGCVDAENVTFFILRLLTILAPSTGLRDHPPRGRLETDLQLLLSGS